MLLWKMKRGNSASVRRIYEKYKNDLLAVACALLNDLDAAEDVVHDVFVSFVQSVDKFQLTGSLKGYLLTCVANLSRDRNRGKKTIALGVTKADSAASGVRTPVQTIISAEELQQLRYAIAQLPYEQREVVILHLHGARTFRQIAALQGTSIGTVQSRYRYGLDKLRSLLNRDMENEVSK